MKTDDEIIAEFMGWTIDNTFPDKDTVYRLGGRIELKTTFKFATSWDWLIPVVEKTRVISNTAHKELHEAHDLNDPNGWRSWSYRRVNLTTDISAVYRQVIEFIKW